MDNGDALAALESTPALSASERLRAARFLARNATVDHRARLSAIRSVEHNSWVRQALDQTLVRLAANTPREPAASMAEVEHASPDDSRRHQEILAEATAETARFFLHELRPLVGLVEVEASREVDDYPASRTKKSIDRVRAFLDAMSRLGVASAPPAMSEFDLTDMVTQAAEDEVERGRATLDVSAESTAQDTHERGTRGQGRKKARVAVALARHEPVVTVGDPALVEMALVNALRNAVEAILDQPECHRGPVILNWGVTDTDSWIAVLDEGGGLPQGLDRLAQPGVSTKDKKSEHVGMGLPIAQQAIDSMGGTFRLAPRTGGGVSCVIRWPSGDLGG